MFRKRRPAPNYHPGPRVWLSAKDLNLKASSKKLAPRFVGPFPVTRNIGPAAVRLRLPQSLRVHPTFHVSQVKPVRESRIVPGTMAFTKLLITKHLTHWLGRSHHLKR